MAIYKCKMCGGTIEFEKGDTVGVCDSCGTKQTLPKTNDDVISNLFNRANNLRLKCEFDKAAQIYEKIVEQDDSEAEAHWGLVLCKYGIEYVEDPKTYKRIPTCHRTQYTSVLSDADYLATIENADAVSKEVYTSEAHEIAELQKSILAIVKDEKPFDVFICYKETDENGKRTQDSVLANDIYYQLAQEGMKVFYSAITLEDKLGVEYEPYIFAALNSAKVMLVVGTKPEYFDAVWVRNEWSRYLKMMKEDRSKLLIPCYKDMDAYDLPEDFSHLQARDMSKIGFINDLVRGIKKVVGTDGPKNVSVKETVVAAGNTNTSSLLERAFMFLEDGDFNSAEEYCEKVLDIEPKCAQAYLGKLMAELRVRTCEGLKDCAEPFDTNNNYQKAIRFADDKLKEALAGYIEHINTRNENTRLDGIYTRAKNAMSAANTESAYKEAAALFESISEYQDSSALAQSCYEKAEAERLEKERKAEIARKEAERIAKRIKKIAINTTPIVCAIIAFIIVLNTVIIPNGKYNEAIALVDAGKLDEAYSAFIELGDYKDASEKAGDIKLQKTKDQLKTIKVGSHINFGAYEQDNVTSNGKEDVEWLVLEIKDGKALVISKYALDCKQYNTSYTDVTWETCTLRKWLNNDFLGAAFSADEKSMIPAVTVSADKNPYFSTNPGNATQDQVFLLSITEANKYFSSESARQCEPTDYAVANGASERDSGNCWWWLRSPGYYQDNAAYVDDSGDVNDLGYDVDYVRAVRPALWIDLNAE